MLYDLLWRITVRAASIEYGPPISVRYAKTISRIPPGDMWAWSPHDLAAAATACRVPVGVAA